MPPKLVELMRQKSSLSIALSTSEAARALQLLLQHAPEMLTQEQQVCGSFVPLMHTVHHVWGAWVQPREKEWLQAISAKVFVRTMVAECLVSAEGTGFGCRERKARWQG